MNLFIRIFLIMMISSISQYFLPWWTSLIVALAVETALGKGDGTSFFSGFYGVSIPWMALSAYIDMNNGSILSKQILSLFHLPQYSAVMIVLTGLIGGIVGGLGSQTGGWIKKAFSKSNG